MIAFYYFLHLVDACKKRRVDFSLNFEPRANQEEMDRILNKLDDFFP